jgi:RND family efflux transporter MFP subunit
MDLAPGFTKAVTPARRLSKRHFLRWLYRFVLLIALAAAAFAAWRYLVRPVEVPGARATRGAVAEVVYATGFVEPRRPVDIASRVIAPVRSVLVDEGDHVSAGQPLVLLDSEDQREVIRQLAAQTLNAKQDERRALALYRQGFLANAARDKAVATATSARAVEAAARAKLDQFTIRSGIAGMILRRDVEPGDLATSTKTLLEIGDPNLLRISATVDERDIPLVRLGAAVMMSSDAFPGRIVRGHVSDITPGGDPDQRAFRVYIQPDSSASLPVGLTLEVNIMVSQKPAALLVPGGAIRDGAVWVVDGGKARKHAIQTGIRGGDRTEVLRGVQAGACVITKPPEDLKDGQRVSAKGC